MATRRQRLNRLERGRCADVQAVEDPPRVAGKTRLQAVLDYIEYYKRLLVRESDPCRRAEIEVSKQKLEQAIPRERELQLAAPRTSRD